MAIQDLIIEQFNGKITWAEMLRGFMEHQPWLMARSAVAGLSMAAFFSSDENYEAAVLSHKPGTFGPASPIDHLDDAIDALPDDVMLLKFEAGGPISRSIEPDDIPKVRGMARATKIERAMHEQRYTDLRRYTRYFVPYFGELGKGHQVICLPTEHGSMIAAFTSEDAVSAFLATGSDENRSRVKFVAVDGNQLFGVAAPAMAEGVIVNIAGPRTFGFVLSTCRDIANA